MIKRNTLYLAMVKLAATLKPQAVVLENVPGMLQTNGGIGAKRIIEDFAEIGYKMTPKLLYAPDYGIHKLGKEYFCWLYEILKMHLNFQNHL